MKSKIILIDSGSFMFRSILNWERMTLNKIKNHSQIFIAPAHYTYYIMLLSSLKKIGVNQGDKILVCLEGKSWRKAVHWEYKGQRKEARESHALINWEKQFNSFNQLHKQLDISTNWHFVREPFYSEADDIISVACRYYKDYGKIIVTADGDLKQLTYYPETYFFTIAKKCKASNGCYEFIDDPVKIIADKSRKGDVSDNIIVRDSDTEEDCMVREELVNLLKLPDYVEKAVIAELDKIQDKEEDLDNLPFKNSKEKYLKIYNSDSIITPTYCFNLLAKRSEKKKKLIKEKKGKKNVSTV